MTIISAAIDLAEKGFAVFPCLPSKAPATPRGFHDASKDPDVIRILWQRWPGSLIGTPTGNVNTFDVLDIDPRHGGDAWHAANRNRLPVTRIHQTRSGGLHILFRHHDGVRNSAGRIAPGIDVRGQGGFVIWWPAGGCPVEAEGAPADWPHWLLPLILPPPPAVWAFSQDIASADPARRSRYAEAALRNAIDRVATAPQGQRNDVLNRETFGLMRLARGGDLALRDIADGMAVAARHAGLTAPEVAATLRSALRSGGAL